MSTTRYASVLGLGFGDCGKGRFVAALTRRWRAHSVVRFNGGAQAGHNVVDAGRHHTFSQFGSGTFSRGVATLLMDPMIVHPTALLVEAEALARTGFTDALARLQIDARCRITTPYHQAAGRLRELVRGRKAHGTCGVGVGETVRHALAHPAEVLRYGELLRGGVDKLHAIRTSLLAELLPQCEGIEACCQELSVLHNEELAGKWMNIARSIAIQCPPASKGEIQARLRRPGCVLFEGAQGVLLDEWRGFHPHTTWSSTTTDAVEQAAAEFGITEHIEHHGVLRSYLTRHGIGPLPTYDEGLDFLPEPHNQGGGWQGRFRRGHPDAVLLGYAIEAVGSLSGLLVSHLDIFDRGVSLKWCERYGVTHRLPLGKSGDLMHQEFLAGQLQSAQPLYAPDTIRTVPGLLERIKSVKSLPVILRSRGAETDDVW